MAPIPGKSPGKLAAAKTHAASASHEDTRDRLIVSATMLFAQRGFDGVSVKELADSAGVNVSLVSYHFGGKENLYRECLEQFGKGRLAAAQRILQPPQSLEELHLKLKMFMEEMFACHLENAHVSQLVHRECEMELPIAPDAFRKTFLKVFETMVEFFSTAQARGIVRRELDPLLVSHLIFGGFKQAVQSDKLSKKFFGLTIADASYRNKLIDHILQCNIFGISAERSKA